MYVCKGVEIIPGGQDDCNMYLLDGEILVDTGTGMFFSEAKEAFKDKDISRIKLIVNTHYHFDHTGGNKKFRDWLKADVAIHTADKKYLQTGQTLAELWNQKDKVITVDRTLRHGNVLKTDKGKFEVISTPGHTPGSICLYEKERRILITGDTLFDGAVGRTDLPGGDLSAMMESLQRLLDFPAGYLLPGHGEVKIGGIDFLIKQMMARINKTKFL